MAAASLLRAFRRRPRNDQGLEAVKGRQKQPGRPPWQVGMAPFFAAVLVWGACAFNVVYRPSRSSYSFVPGQEAPTNIYAQVDFEYIDQAATRIARRRARNNVINVYRIDSAANEVTQQNVAAFFRYVARAKSTATRTHPADAGRASAPAFEALDDAELDAMQVLFDNEDKRNAFAADLQAVLADGILDPADQQRQTNRQIWVVDEVGRRKKTDLGAVRVPRRAARELSRRVGARLAQGLPPRTDITRLMQDVLPSLIRPNLMYDDGLTAKDQKLAVQRVPEVRRGVAKGAVFVRKGHTLNAADLARVAAHQAAVEAARDNRQFAMHVLSVLLLCALVVGLAVFYLNAAPDRGALSGRHAIMLALTCIVNVAMIRGTEELVLTLLHTQRFYMLPALPLAFTAILATLLLSPGIGMTLGVFMSLLAALQVDESMHVLILGLTTACGSAFAVRNARTRTHTLRGALAIVLCVMAVESVYLGRNITPWKQYLFVFGIAAANGLATLVVVNLVLPLWETVFGITTAMNLLELSDLNHPLLKRLQMEAPGTYHHTLVVATLAEHAAEAVGANTLLARVAAYFHDIGKLSNPSYFTENSAGSDRHEDLSPRMSALIIINHMKEGLALARKYKLKAPIREVIQSHHGTGLVYYFYRRAKDEAAGADEDVSKEDYRYPGILPRSREASIVSLADACEAASRSLQKPTPQKIDALVGKIMKAKLDGGQLADSELTMREIAAVEACIKRNLRTMLHGRIAYPGQMEHEPAAKQAARRPAADQAAASADDHPPSGGDHRPSRPTEAA